MNRKNNSNKKINKIDIIGDDKESSSLLVNSNDSIKATNQKNFSSTKGNNSAIAKKSNKFGWVSVLCIVLGIVLISLFAYSLIITNKSTFYKIQLENSYKHAYMEVINNINSLELDLSKVVATTSKSTQKKMFQSIYTTCNLANTNISNLPLASNKIKNINKLVNNLGGFSFSLLEKLNNENSLNTADFKNITAIHSHTLSIMYDLNLELSNLKFSKNIVDQLDYNNIDNAEFGGGLINVESTNSKVPSLIYDGPFSDSVLNREIRGLNGKIASKEECFNLIKKHFTKADIIYAGETLGKFKTYNFRVTNNSNLMFFQVAKQGAQLLNITTFANAGNKNLDVLECEAIAKQFLLNFGFKKMNRVWATTNSNVCYLNFAPIIDNIIYYPDLIKIKVDKSTGEVIGFEGTNYAYNHIEREKFKTNYSINDGEKKISPELKIVQKNITRIPNEFVGESFAYEYIAKWQNYTYYIYLDVLTLKELNLMRVVSTSAGDLIL